jgi:hypothetical protein
MSKRKFIGLCGGLSLEGRQDNSMAVKTLENDFGFFKTSPLDEISIFAKTIGMLKDVNTDYEKRIIINKVCISGMEADRNIWINTALKSVPSDKMYILIDDVHFKEEAETIKKLGGTLVQINLPGSEIVKPSFEPDVIIFGNTKEDMLKSFKLTLHNILDSDK